LYSLRTFEESKKVGWGLIVAVLTVGIALSVWINLYGFREGLLDVWLFDGLINATLAANLLSVAVVVIGLLSGVGRLCFKDVGLHRRQIATALLGGLTVWSTLQPSALAVALVRVLGSCEPALARRRRCGYGRKSYWGAFWKRTL